MESELIALDTTCSETEWLKDVLSEFSIIPRPILPISVHTDSRSTIEILEQDNTNKKMIRHIQIRLKSVQHILSKVVLLDFVKSEKNIAEYGPRIIEGDGVKPIVDFTDSGNPTYLIGS